MVWFFDNNVLQYPIVYQSEVIFYEMLSNRRFAQKVSVSSYKVHVIPFFFILWTKFLSIISGVQTKNKLPSISFPPNLFEKNDTTQQFDKTKFMDAVKELSNDNHMCPRITFLDFAGQSMDYAFQQIYLGAKTCYILVVDMKKHFDEHVNEKYERCCSLFESRTYKGI